MRKFLIALVGLVAVAFLVTGCGVEVTGDTAGDTNIDNGVDNSYTDTSDRSYTVTDSNGTVTYFSATSPEALTDEEMKEGIPSKEIVGVYDASYTQVECGQAGFFFCTLSGTCQNSPAYSSSCSSR